MARTVVWKIGLYDLAGNSIDTVGYDIDTGAPVTDEFIKHATNLQWQIPLNGIDQLDFTLYLDDDAASWIFKKKNIIRVWRYVDDAEVSKTLTPPDDTPDFCGLVTATNKDGEANTMQVTAMSPLWKLQTHFHIDNHRLELDAASYIDPPAYEGGNGDNAPWDQSALMFRLIDMINGAFHASGGDTGIRKPPTAAFSGSYWPRTIDVSPFFVEKGSYTWSLIFDNLMARSGAPDIVPQYIYVAASKDLMYFNTAITRGNDVSATFSFDYRTGRKNLENLTEGALVVPGGYGNFQWVVGDGGPNGGFYKQDSDLTDIGLYGIYMVRKDVQGSKLADVTSLGPAELKVALANDAEVYTATISSAIGDYYGIDYSVGDLIELNADKGALQVSAQPQRIAAVTLSWSENNVETVDAQITRDFKGKFA